MNFELDNSAVLIDFINDQYIIFAFKLFSFIDFANGDGDMPTAGVRNIFLDTRFVR